jgi:O-antigen ligase
MKLISPDWLPKLKRFLWGAVLLALPVTSFRYMPFLGSDTQVKPLSLLPAALLLLVLLAQCVQERRMVLWDNHYLPLIAFILLAGAASAIGYLLAPAQLYSYTYPGRVIRAWLSFGVGLVFLLTSVCMNRNEEDLKFTIKWIYLGLIAEVGWSVVQLLQIYFNVIPSLDTIQKTVMMAGLPPNDRISGLALEPSWLAAQVIVIYLPWAVAAFLKNVQWGISRKWLLPIFAACLFLLVFSYSRAGILIAAAALALTFLGAGWQNVQQGWKWFILPIRNKIVFKQPLEVGFRVVILVALLAGLAGGAIVLSRNKYFAQIWQSDKTNLTDYFIDIYAGPRLAYSVAGWTIFEQHPWTGVGLGGVGLYMIQALPDWAHINISETAQLLSPDNNVIPNTKNLYTRLLAETGILGFWAFLTFYLLMLGTLLRMIRSKKRTLTYLGTASLMGWLAIVLLGVTQDSLAMPLVWIPFGILIGMASSVKKEQAQLSEAE